MLKLPNFISTNTMSWSMLEYPVQSLLRCYTMHSIGSMFRIIVMLENKAAATEMLSRWYCIVDKI